MLASKEPADSKLSPNRPFSRAVLDSNHHRPKKPFKRSLAMVGLVFAAAVLSTVFLYGQAVAISHHDHNSKAASDSIMALPLLLGERSSPEQTADNVDYPMSTSPFAYTFVVGGCDPTRPESYQNYLFNIAISAKILKERGSMADVVALFQVSESAESHELAHEDLKVLHALGVYVYYIPQQTHGQQSFYRKQVDKFRILGMEQYQRILFLDGDIMPIANLDYLFEMSVNGTLRENVVFQGFKEPANGGEIHNIRINFTT